MMLLTGCVTTQMSGNAVCSGLRGPSLDLSDALIEDGGPKSIVAGDKLISGLRAGCKY